MYQVIADGVITTLHKEQEARDFFRRYYNFNQYKWLCYNFKIIDWEEWVPC